jgi:hypothetical protein
MPLRCKKIQELLSYVTAGHHKLFGDSSIMRELIFAFYKTIFVFPVKVAKGNDKP